MKFLVQDGGTDPAKWETVEASDLRHAGAKVAARRGVGRWTVYVTPIDGPKYPNGSPIEVHGIEYVVEPRRALAQEGSGA